MLSLIGLQDCSVSVFGKRQLSRGALHQDCEQQKLHRKTAEEALVDVRKSRTQAKVDLADARTLEVQ